MEYSVLMPVYEKEAPAFFRGAIESMLSQTVPPSDFVISCDGPLTEALDQVIAEAVQNHPGLFQILRKEERQGLVATLNAGLAACRFPVVARMDSDDLSLPQRMEVQLQWMEEKGLDLLSSSVREFSGEAASLLELEKKPSCLGTVRQLPEEQKEILVFARRRNPMNHPSVVFKKSLVEAVGGYPDCPGFEDYYLWLTLLRAGARGCNVPEPLVFMRAGEGMYRRRGGMAYTGRLLRFYRRLRREGFLSRREYLQSVIPRTFVSLAPNRLRQCLYTGLLRKHG